MAGISFEELIGHVGISADKLNQKCSDQHISDISLFLTNWQSIAPHLGLTETDEEDVEQDGKKAQDRRYKALRTWKAKYSFKATYKALVDVLLKIGRADFAEKVCTLLVDKGATATVTSVATPSHSDSARKGTGDEELTDEDIPDVSDYFGELNSPHLLNLGLALGIAYTHLKDMEKMPMAEYRAELAAQWIKGADQVKKKGKATWRRLVEALRTKRLGQNGLADKIENDKCS